MPGGNEKTPLIELSERNSSGGAQLASLGEGNDGKQPVADFSQALGKYAVLIVIGFLALGTIGFHYIEGTGTWWDALYFSCVTLTTVGYGDMTPSTDGGKILAIFFILIGGLLIRCKTPIV